jgi:hypothetical protein
MFSLKSLLLILTMVLAVGAAFVAPAAADSTEGTVLVAPAGTDPVAEVIIYGNSVGDNCSFSFFGNEYRGKIVAVEGGKVLTCHLKLTAGSPVDRVTRHFLFNCEVLLVPGGVAKMTCRG